MANFGNDKDGITISNPVAETLMDQNTTKPVPENVPDGGYGWVIVVACFMCGMLVQGIVFSFGVFFIYFVEYYDEPKAKIAWIASLLIGWSFMAGPLAGASANTFGFRPVVIVGSIGAAIATFLSSVSPSVEILQLLSSLIGIGFGLVCLSSFMCVAHYFKSKRGFATGIASSGSCVGSFIFPPIINMLMKFYDFKGTMIILSGLILNGTVFGALLRPLTNSSKSQVQRKLNISMKTFKKENNLNGSEKQMTQNMTKIISCNSELHHNTNLNLRQDSKNNCKAINCFKRIIQAIEHVLCLRLLRNKAFLLLCICDLFALMGLSAPIIHLPHNAVLKNIKKDDAVLLLTVFGVLNLLGRIILGYIVDKFKISALIVHNICVCVSGIAIIIIIFCSSYINMSLTTAFIGFNTAAILSLQPLILVDILGLPLLNSGLGLLSVFQGISMMIGPPFAGFLLDMIGNYDTTFGIAGAFFILQAIILSFIPKLVKSK